MDKLTKEQRRRNMQAVKNKGSKIEQRLAKALWNHGLRYRKNNKKIYGTPDLTFVKYKIAIFCDSEFWHGKDWELRKNDHKSNIKFWHNKIEKNIERDILVNKELIKQGWTILRYWGKDIDKNLEACVSEILTYYNKAK